MTEAKRVPLYERLPEIYRIRDSEQLPPGQLAAYLGAVEDVFGALHENIEALYNELFIDTCDEWVIPYIADLLGTTHLKGDLRTLRADVADTIALRRRKGTLGAIERLAAEGITVCTVSSASVFKYKPSESIRLSNALNGTDSCS